MITLSTSHVLYVADPDGTELATQEDVPDNRRDVSFLANSLKSALEADDDNGNRRDVDADTLHYLSGWIQKQLPSSLNRVSTELKVALLRGYLITDCSFRRWTSKFLFKESKKATMTVNLQ